MKKRCKTILLYGSMFVVMNILFAACSGEVKETVLPHASPTVTSTVTQPPSSTQAVTTTKPEKDAEPTPSPTKEPGQHITPMPSELPTLTQTVTPCPTATVMPTSQPTATAIPVLTVTPTPQPTVTPTMMITPTPARNPLTLVYAGWQQITEPSGRYTVVFPDMYDIVNLTQEAAFFKYVYTTSVMSDIKLELCFHMEESVELRKEKIIEQYPEVKMRLHTDGVAYYVETEDVFVAGEVYAWDYEAAGIHGVMQIETSYPKEKKEEYQKEMYHWYVCVSKEE